MTIRIVLYLWFVLLDHTNQLLQFLVGDRLSVLPVLVEFELELPTR